MNSVRYVFATCIITIPSFILQSVLQYITCIQVDIKVEFKKVIMFSLSLFLGILKTPILLSSSLTNSKRKFFENYIMVLTWYVPLNNLIICILFFTVLQSFSNSTTINYQFAVCLCNGISFIFTVNKPLCIINKMIIYLALCFGSLKHHSQALYIEFKQKTA
jgi:hypothetical protein